MSGREIENLLTLIDANLDMSESRVQREVSAYLKDRHDFVLDQLAATGSVCIPTSVGVIEINKAELEAAAA